MTQPRRSASAGILLALALAALALAGCGGGGSSSDSTSTSTAAPNGAASGGGAEAGGGNGASPAAGSRGGAGGAGNGAAEAGVAGPGGSNSAGGGAGSHAGSGKHGPRVAQPSGPPEPKITAKQREEATVASMSLRAPAIAPSANGPQALPVQYTCDGKNTSPALSWGGVPQGTEELALFAMNVRPVEGKLFFDWAVAGIDPDLGEIDAGSLPKGAVVGRNSFGKAEYEICPPGGGETYMFALFALPRKLSPGRGFEPLAFRKAVSDVSHNAGLMALSYSRG